MEPRTMLYDLEGELTYSKAGNFESTCQIEIDAPSYATFAESTTLAQAFTAALFDQRDRVSNAGEAATDQPAGDAKLGKTEVKLVLFGAKTDFAKIADAFIALCVKSATLDQERKTKMRKEHFAKVSYNDIIGMVCEYIAIFIVPSVL